MKMSFTIDVATKEMNKDKQEVWILENSTAYNEEQNKLKEIQNKQSELSSEVSSLENKKQTLNTEIQQLNSDVTKIKGEPKKYPAGQLTAGTDIPTGKYKIYGGNSNFIVYSSSGKLEVNIVLVSSKDADLSTLLIVLRPSATTSGKDAKLESNKTN